MTPNTLPAIYFHSLFSPPSFVRPPVLSPPFLHENSSLPHSRTSSILHLLTPSPSFTHWPTVHALTRTHARAHSSAPEGSNRRYLSVSLPSPRPHVSLQQISGQRCRKPRFCGWKHRTEVCEWLGRKQRQNALVLDNLLCFWLTCMQVCV